MREYVTSAIVLSTKNYLEHDRIVDLFTRDLGKIRARVPGGRKLLSKFSPHLGVLREVIVRLVHKHSFTIADALTENSFSEIRGNVRKLGAALNVLSLIRVLFAEQEPDNRLWHHVRRAFSEGNVSYAPILLIAGYDSAQASCVQCGNRPVHFFSLHDHAFFCMQCSVHARESEVLLVH